MIQSILDNDLYKFTMQQAAHTLYPRAQAEYTFTNRGATPFPHGFAQKIGQEVEKMALFSLSQEQKTYLKFGLQTLGHGDDFLQPHTKWRLQTSSAMDAWIKVFKGDLGIALADTYTTDLFLSAFDLRLASFFDGVRQDSGDPLAFIQKLVAHYETLHIDPAAKIIVFSDGLDTRRALAIHNECKGKIKDAYGIGTHLTNDVGVTPLNMVIKMSRCQTGPEKPWQHTVKISDDRGKHTGNRTELDSCMKILSKFFHERSL